MKVGIHIFRKDLRIVDNLALNDLNKKVDKIIGLFIFDSKQIKKTTTNEAYYSIRAAQFIIDSVNDLNTQCNNSLLVSYGNPTTVIEDILKTIQPSAISFNADFTPYATKRDDAIVKICNKYKIETIINNDDQTLIPMQSLLKKDGMPFMVYGPFYKQFAKQKVNKPSTSRVTWYKPKLNVNDEPLQWNLIEPTWIGGRKEALKRLKNKTAVGATDQVAQETSQLSTYMNQGCISIREVYWTFKEKYKSIEPIRSIVWRDFFLCIYRFDPSGNSYTSHIDKRYDQIKWPKVKESEWSKFINCNTGFLLVDAAMTELLTTGFINNRSRLILGTFWVKYLMIDPLDEYYGSQVWFSKLLIDCISSQNKLNHQWILSELDLSGRRFAMRGTSPLTGRSMRIDNDTIKRYDKNYEYIKKWLPEFKDKSVKECKELTKKIKPMYEWKERYMQYAKLFNNLPR